MDETKDTRRLASLPDNELVAEVLGSWATVNASITKLSRRQLVVLIDEELRGKRRVDILKRVHQRFCQVRRKQELGALNNCVLELDNGAPGPDVFNDQTLGWLSRELVRQEDPPKNKRRKKETT